MIKAGSHVNFLRRERRAYDEIAVRHVCSVDSVALNRHRQAISIVYMNSHYIVRHNTTQYRDISASYTPMRR